MEGVVEEVEEAGEEDIVDELEVKDEEASLVATVTFMSPEKTATVSNIHHYHHCFQRKKNHNVFRMLVNCQNLGCCHTRQNRKNKIYQRRLLLHLLQHHHQQLQ